MHVAPTKVMKGSKGRAAFCFAKRVRFLFEESLGRCGPEGSQGWPRLQDEQGPQGVQATRKEPKAFQGFQKSRNPLGQKLRLEITATMARKGRLRNLLGHRGTQGLKEMLV